MPALMNNTVRAGKYRKRVTIQLDTSRSTDPANQSVPNWQPFTTAWCEIRAITGRELELAKQLVAAVTHIVEMRYQPGITDLMRILYVDGITQLNRIMGISAVIDHEELHKKLYLLCNESPAITS